ncbi:MAG: cytochrome c biogenesis protein CcsA [Anaerolineae bacterium]|nr:cytochrome c biogenesis protein CcsA [Anaerolineae bacterium]
MKAAPSAGAAASVSQTGAPLALKVLTVLTVAAIAAGAVMALVYAGQDVTQGNVQRIFYFHVASFAGAFVSFAVGVVGGILFLIKRNSRWDSIGLAGVEVGFMLALINLFTGMIWARPIWNTWWTWDPRLTSAAIMVLTYAAYFMLRAGIDNPDTRRRFASVYAILAFSTVIITFVIIRIRPDTIHPTVIGPSPQNAEGSFEMTGSMLATLSWSSFVWSVLVPITFIWWRLRLENLSEHVTALKARAFKS